MSEFTVSIIAFSILLAAVHAGNVVTTFLPQHHLDEPTRDTMKRSIALVVTMTALVLGLLISSGKNSFDKQSEAASNLSAEISHLDELLVHFGPEADTARERLRAAVDPVLASLWADITTQGELRDENRSRNEAFIDSLLTLTPATEGQTALKSQAMTVANSMIEGRFKLATLLHSVIPTPMIVIIMFWLALVFASFGFLSPPNPTAFSTIYAAVLSATGAIFLILEFDKPFSGLIQISNEPLQVALAALNR